MNNMEKFPTSIPSSVDSSLVEAEANFEGNDTELLMSRVKDPVIRAQIVEILYQQDLHDQEFYRTEEWEPYLPDDWTGEEKFKLMKGRKSGKIIDAEILEANLEAFVSREKIEKELDERIDGLEKLTEIDFTANEPTAGVIPLDWLMPHNDKKPTAKQMSVIEAHEKGHRIRHYDDLTTERFVKAFDLSRVEFTEEFYELLKKNASRQTDREGENVRVPKTFEDERDKYLNGYLFTAMEIAERMSQLKNYFGMNGSKQFTKEHLIYAKEHYIQDTDFDNGMSFFLQAITPETEEAFLEIINNAGI